MVSRVVITLTCRKKWLVADLPLRPPPCLELLHQSRVRFSSDRQILATEIPCSHLSPVLNTSKADRTCEDEIKRTQSEFILESLRKLAASSRFRRATRSKEVEALSDALRTLGLEKHTKELQYTGNLLPVVQKVQLLVSEAVSTSDMTTLFRTRAFLGTSLEKFAAVFNQLKRFFSTGEAAAKVLASNSGVLLQSMEHLVTKFKHLEEFEVDKESRLRMSIARSGVLAIKEDSLHERLAFLRDIGLSIQSRNRILRVFPQVLRLSIDVSMQPTIDFLQSRGMDRAIVLKLVRTHPDILGMSVNKNLAIKFDLLIQLGFTTEECCKAIGYMAKRSCKFLLSRFDFLKNQGFSDDDVSFIIRKYPFILSKSEEGIKIRIDYLVNVAKCNLKEIVKFPPCLGYSLEKRIIPRFNILLEMDILKKYSMSSILIATTESFKKRFMIPNEHHQSI